MKHALKLQEWCAIATLVCALGLLIAGFVVNPSGEIHHSVLVGFGECSALLTALLRVPFSRKLLDKK